MHGGIWKLWRENEQTRRLELQNMQPPELPEKRIMPAMRGAKEWWRLRRRLRRQRLFLVWLHHWPWCSPRWLVLHRRKLWSPQLCQPLQLLQVRCLQGGLLHRIIRRRHHPNETLRLRRRLLRPPWLEIRWLDMHQVHIYHFV